MPLCVPSRGRFEKSWWVASEFLRRHPDYTVREDHLGGIYDVLILSSRYPATASEPSSSTPMVILNRAGTIQVHGVGNPEQQELVATWEEVAAMEDPHEIVRIIERAARLDLPNKTPPTNFTVLVYRVLSAALTRKVNDRVTWDVREVDDSGGWVWTLGQIRPQLEAFDTAMTDTEFLYQRSQGHAWFLLRGDEPVAVTSKSGVCHFREASPLTLMEVYSRRRRLDDVVDELFLRIEGLTHL